MNEKGRALTQLRSFRGRKKFSASAWKDRGLQPSNIDLCDLLENLFNEVAENLVDAVERDFTPKQTRRVIENGLRNFRKSDYDTEERELICDYFHELSSIVEIDFNRTLNTWLYGRMLSIFLSRPPAYESSETTVETLCQICTSCNSKLETFIIQKEQNIPDTTWLVVECTICNEFNLLSLAPNIKELRYGNYRVVEHLARNDCEEDQAKTRLEQIKLFKGKP